MAEDQAQTDVVELATELTIAWLSNPNTRAEAREVSDFLQTVHDAVTGLTGGAQTANAAPQEQAREPAVTVRKSLASPEHIISLIDGKPYKTLKRHLANNGLTPTEYRQRYGLKSDYPMVAPEYAERRRTLAKAIGLGRKPQQSAGNASTPSEANRSKAKAEAEGAPSSRRRKTSSKS